MILVVFLFCLSVSTGCRRNVVLRPLGQDFIKLEKGESFTPATDDFYAITSNYLFEIARVRLDDVEID